MDTMVSTVRQHHGLVESIEALKKAQDAIASKASPEIVALEMRESLRWVQEVLGKQPSDEIMDRVFKEFCIGK
jgi:tRNA modification GTPase